MNNLSRSTILTGTLLVVCGCSSVSNRVQSLVSRSPAKDDPLASVITQETSESYRQAKKELDHSEETLLKFARWREDMGDHAEAKSQYADILADNSNCVEARLGIARVEFATGRVNESIEILQATARKYPKQAKTWAELGRIQMTRKEWGAAVTTLSKAYDLEPTDQTIRYELGIALARADRLEEARSHLAYAVGESAALYNIGYVLHESGREEQSGHWFRRALNSHPDQRTERAASQMLAQLNGVTPTAPNQQEPSRVDIASTTYESWRENPGMAVADARRQQQEVAAGQQGSPQRPQNAVRTVSQQGPAQGKVSFATNTAPQWAGPSNTAGTTIVSPSSGFDASQQPIQPPQWGGPNQ